MGGRGTFAAGKNDGYAYETVGMINGVKVLQGKGKRHNLPAEAHSSTAYIRLNPDGTFHEMRVYDKEHYLSMQPHITGVDKFVWSYSQNECIAIRYISRCIHFR